MNLFCKPSFFLANLLVLFVFSVLRISLANSAFFDNAIQIYEILVHFVLVYNSYAMYSKCDSQDKNIFMWFLITNVFFLLNDAGFYIALFLTTGAKLLMSTNYPYLSLWINNTPFFAWLISLIFCLFIMLTKYVINIKLFTKLFISFLIIDILLMSYYWKPVNFHTEILSFWHSFFLLATSVIEFIIFELCILCLIYTKNKHLLFIAAGFIIAISGDLLTTYGRMAQISRLFLYGDSIWCSGIIFIFWGTSGILKTNSYRVQEWFNHINDIKSLISSWALSISIGGLLLFLIAANALNLIDKNALIVSPLIIMLYSIIVVILTIYMGKVLENPFKEIEKNVKSVLAGNKVYFKENLKIKEFAKLQQFFMHSFELKEQQDLLRKKFGDIAGQAVHDLGSPIKALHVAIRELREQGIDTEALNLDLCVNRLHEYQTSILSYYRKIPDEEQPSNKIADINIDKYILINNLINSIIEFKRIEWANSPAIIKISTTKDCENLWIKLNAIQFECCLSNLLNNAYESLNKPEKVIEVHLYQLTSKLILEIIDNGCGIPAHMVKQVMLGYSTKHPGKGLGLSGAKEYFNQLNGSLDIFPNDSSDENSGTKIIISIPIANKPKWHFDSIYYNPKSILVILDDDFNILKTWQTILISKRIKTLMFNTVNEYMAWMATINEYDNHILLTDYDLNHRVNGLEILNQSPFAQKYLITALADAAWLQKICVTTDIKLSHKRLISSINFISTPL